MSNLLSKIRELSFKDNQDKLTRLAYPIPQKNNNWGVLDFLKETHYKKYIKYIDEELINQALFGYPIPLLNSLGRDPREYYRSMKKEDSLCVSLLDKSCPNADPLNCQITGKGPLCYQSPLNVQLVQHQELLYYVTSSWNDGRYVIVLKES